MSEMEIVSKLPQSPSLIMNKLCRSCMNESNELQSIFEMAELVPQLSEMLMACASVEVSSTDGLPSSMCQICIHELNNAFTFKQKCESTDTKLREYLINPEFDIKEEKEVDNIIVKPDIDINPTDIFDDTFDNGNDDWDLSDDEPETDQNGSKLTKQCHICQKILSSNVGLKLHLRKHDKEKSSETHICELCGFSFDKSGDLVKHKAEKHEPECKENDVKSEVEDSEPTTEILPAKRTRKPRVKSEPTTFECTECNKVLSTLNGLQVHARRHTGKNLANCYKCSKSFTKLSHLKRHLLTHGIQNPSPEDVKSESGKTKRDSYQCEFCDRKFVYKKSFSHHMKMEHAISDDEPNYTDDLKPDQEGVILEEENGIEEERDDEGHIDGQEYECHVCNQKFPRANHLTRHMTLHRNVLNHKCEQCEKVYLTQEHLEIHMNENHRQKPYTCTKCNKQFNRGEHLIRHLKSDHPDTDDTDPYPCSVCEKIFTKSDQLAKHVKQHILNDKRHVCKHCSKAFNRLDNLRTHLRVHTGEVAVRLHLCIYCGKEFNNSSNMIVHMRRHTGERPYKCQVCGKGFPRSHDLKCHERTHSGERPYLCTLCGKSFNKSNKLVRHTRVHTGERPYVCSLCGRAFTQSNDLSLHMRRHTGSRPYACGVCPARFIQSGQLKAHRRTQGHWVEQEIQFRGNRVEPVHIEGLVETKIKYRKPRTTQNPIRSNGSDGGFGLAMIREAATLVANNREQSNDFESNDVPDSSANYPTGFNFQQFG